LLLAKALRAAGADPAEVSAHADVAAELLAELGDAEAEALAEARALR
jgi:hypothetical protein